LKGLLDGLQRIHNSLLTQLGRSSTLFVYALIMTHRLPAVPPISLVLLSIVSTQLGSALAKSLFQVMSPAGVVLLRVGFAAILLLLWWRSHLKGNFCAHWRTLTLFGLSLGLMNLSFYLAIERIPIGVAVALEFLGPLGVAVFNSRRRLDWLWVMLAAIGIFLLAPIHGFVIDLTGIGFALVAGSFWASYIILAKRVGAVLSGGAGLALAMAIATLILLPIGIWTEGMALLQPDRWLPGVGVALLSSAIPYSLELSALRYIPVQLFGILLSLEPMTAALMGFLVLGETLNTQAMMAIVLITIAAAGASRFTTRE
jgi:inner membrane transporter RhtA